MHFALAYWKSWEDMAEATYKIVDNKVAFALHRTPPHCTTWWFSETNDACYEGSRKGLFPINYKEHAHAWETIIAGHSKREFEFKKSVYEQIVKDTSGQFATLTSLQQEMLFSAIVMVTYDARVFRPTGEFATSFGLEESIGLLGKLHRTGAQVMARHVGPDKLPDHGPEGFFAWLTEGRQLHSESAFAGDPFDPGVRKAVEEHTFDVVDAVNNDNLGVHILPGYAPPFGDMVGPSNFNANAWTRKVKYEVVDPDNVADPLGYVLPEPTSNLGRYGGTVELQRKRVDAEG